MHNWHLQHHKDGRGEKCELAEIRKRNKELSCVLEQSEKCGHDSDHVGSKCGCECRDLSPNQQSIFPQSLTVL